MFATRTAITRYIDLSLRSLFGVIRFPALALAALLMVSPAQAAEKSPAPVEINEALTAELLSAFGGMSKGDYITASFVCLHKDSLDTIIQTHANEGLDAAKQAGQYAVQHSLCLSTEPTPVKFVGAISYTSIEDDSDGVYVVAITAPGGATFYMPVFKSRVPTVGA